MLSKRPMSTCSLSDVRSMLSVVYYLQSDITYQEYDVYNLLQYTIIFFILITVLLNKPIQEFNCFIG